MRRKYDVRGMSCAACSAAVERAVGKIDGVSDVQVSLLANEMSCEFDESITNDRAVVAAVKKAGYRASVQGSAEAVSDNDGFTPVRTRLIVSVCFLVPLLYISMGHMVGLPLPHILHGNENSLSFAFTQLLLCLPILYVNRKFFIGGFGALFKGSPNMDSLVAVGSSAAVAYGIAAVYLIGWGLGHGNIEIVQKYSADLYFESAATILTLVTVGKYLEERSKGRTNEAVKKLLDLSPKTAIVERDGREITLPAEQIAVGDIVVIKPGGRVPVDGTVINGGSALDESALTGEPMPVDKTVGDNVISASVNTTGTFKMRASKVGSETTLAQIISLVRNASASKAPVARLADKVAGIFVPVVMAIAAVTAVIWLIAGQGIASALSNGVAVLVISCPCALGLATPVAITAAAGRCASKGILIKSAAALETLHSTDTVVFDKTGTLTQGKPEVTAVSVSDKSSENELLTVAASLEHGSEHPLAHAITAYTSSKQIEPQAAEQFVSVSGRGVSAIVNGSRCIGGNLSFMRESSVDTSGIASHSGTAMYFARENLCLGAIYASDSLRPTSAEAVAALHKMGIETVMLTGDTHASAEPVAASAGIKTIISDVLPADKEKAVASLKSGGKTVAMVGDGINDSPALASSDIGIAAGSGSDIAIDSAGIVLMKSDMRDVPEAIRCSRLTIRNIKQNLFWAFFYNIICIPIAAGALYIPFGITLSPMIAAAAMSLSSLFVVTNALRLYRM